jgi:hypothetical protein
MSASTLELAATGTHFVTVMAREFFFNGELEQRVGDAIATASDGVVLDVVPLAPLDDIAAAKLERAWRRLSQAGVELVLICPPDGLPEHHRIG